VVCGPSGSGKSTLIKAIHSLESFRQREVIVDGASITDPKTRRPSLRSRVATVFQRFELVAHLSLTENLILAQIKVLGRSCNDATIRGPKVLERRCALPPRCSGRSRPSAHRLLLEFERVARSCRLRHLDSPCLY